MTRAFLSIVATAVLGGVLFLLPAQASSSMTSHRLTGTVGPGFTIELTKAGQVVKTLRAGTYTIKVVDKASIHNFHLFGPGVNKKTGVAFEGTQTWTVKLRKGHYTYQCDPHHLVGLRDHFRVI